MLVEEQNVAVLQELMSIVCSDPEVYPKLVKYVQQRQIIMDLPIVQYNSLGDVEMSLVTETDTSARL